MERSRGQADCLPARDRGGDQGRSGRQLRGSPGLGFRGEVFILELLGVGSELCEPALVVEQPQRATKRVGGALSWLSGFPQDALVLLCRAETNRSWHRPSLARCCANVRHSLRQGVGVFTGSASRTGTLRTPTLRRTTTGERSVTNPCVPARPPRRATRAQRPRRYRRGGSTCRRGPARESTASRQTSEEVALVLPSRG